MDKPKKGDFLDYITNRHPRLMVELAINFDKFVTRNQHLTDPKTPLNPLAKKKWINPDE